MKKPNVLLLNGSPHQYGCTHTALSEVAGALESCGVETEIFWLGKDPLAGCLGCGACGRLGKCVLDDVGNAAAEKARACDGLGVGSPVHYAAASGQITSALDRLFRSAGGALRLKPAAAVASARRAGTTATLDQLHKYFTISQMPVVSSRYWNMVHGNTPEEVRRDEEGMAVMRTLGRNMAWLLQSIQAGREAGLTPPEEEPPVKTNFIR
ncbi:MAG: flavodoxin family protein [Oscillospiraceae bacterium]|nr:flavodoxin family protein [Oscillospiraceae bacterium]